MLKIWIGLILRIVKLSKRVVSLSINVVFVKSTTQDVALILLTLMYVN